MGIPKKRVYSYLYLHSELVPDWVEYRLYKDQTQEQLRERLASAMDILQEAHDRKERITQEHFLSLLAERSNITLSAARYVLLKNESDFKSLRHWTDVVKEKRHLASSEEVESRYVLAEEVLQEALQKGEVFSVSELARRMAARDTQYRPEITTVQTYINSQLHSFKVRLGPLWNEVIKYGTPTVHVNK